jgi:hypothetical protein
MRKFLLIVILSVFAYTVKAQTPLTTAVDFTVTTVDGPTFNLFNTLAANKYVCIDFFYYGCVPCQQTAPKVNGAYEYFGCNTSNVYFIGINNSDNTTTTISFGTDFGAHYPAASGLDGGGAAVNTTYGITAYPTVILIAPNHDIVEQDIWPIADAAYLYNLIQGHGGVPASCPSGIEENQKGNLSQITNVFPNPANEDVQLTLNLKESGTVTLLVVDVMGKLVYRSTDQKMVQGRNNIGIPLTDIGNGMYYIQMINEGASVDCHLLNVMH